MTDLLIVDDFGVQALTPERSEALYQMVCDRYLRRSTIFVANRPREEWYHLLDTEVPKSLPRRTREVVAPDQALITGKWRGPQHQASG